MGTLVLAAGIRSKSLLFSFIEPERVFVNYYWGFQALIAGIYEFGGYYGLLVLRALIFTLTTVLAYRYIIEERSRHFPVLLFFHCS